VRSTSLRIALAFARPGVANVLICHWHGLDFSGDGVWLRGGYYLVTNTGSIEAHPSNKARPVEALFLYGPDSGELTEKDTPVLDRLCAAGIDAHGVPIHIAIDRMMLEASRRGVVTNALGSSRAWGPKHNQELKLRSYERAGGHAVVRPRTYVARPHELRAVLSAFAAQAESCIIKPVFGEGGRGLRIVRPGDAFPHFDCTVVVQRLIPNPLLVEGHKADLRWYLLLDVDDRTSSGRLSPVLIRRTVIPYKNNAETEAAEITNTSYRRRRGLNPDMRLFAPMPDIPQHLYEEIIAQLDSLASDLVDAYFWDATHQCADGTEAPNRRIVFGIDALVADAAGNPRVFFLEANPFPAFFREVPDCDGAVENMLAREYLPALTR
jgi:hypothetical protein